MASRRELWLCFSWARSTLTAMLGGSLTCILLAAAPVHALDPNKRITQYIAHVLANTGWFRAGRHVHDCANLRRFPLVPIFSRRYLQIRWCPVSSLASAC